MGGGAVLRLPKKGMDMASATTKLTKGWCFRSRYACVHAFRVAQGRTLPFLGVNGGTKLEITW